MLGDAARYADFAPLAERAVGIDDAATIRFRCEPGTIAGFVRLPYDVVAGRTIHSDHTHTLDITVAASDLLSWLDEGGPEPARRDAHWLSPLPPAAGWTRVDAVPDATIRELVRRGATIAKDTATRTAQDSLLSSIVLTVTGNDRTVEIPLGMLSALTRLGFLPRDSKVAVDSARGWLRVAAPFGSTYRADGLHGPGPLTLLN